MNSERLKTDKYLGEKIEQYIDDISDITKIGFLPHVVPLLIYKSAVLQEKLLNSEYVIIIVISQIHLLLGKYEFTNS